MNAPVQQPVDFDTRVAQYVKLRDRIKEIEDKHKAELKPFKQALETLNGMLLDHLNQVGADSVTSAAGNVHKKLTKSATIADKAALWAWVVANGDWDLLDYKANVTAVRDHVEKHGAPPPGVNYTEAYDVGVRRGK